MGTSVPDTEEQNSFQMLPWWGTTLLTILRLPGIGQDGKESSHGGLQCS